MNAPILDPFPHEFGGNLIFTEHDLSPYFALDRQVKNGGRRQLSAFSEYWSSPPFDNLADERLTDGSLEIQK